ncbi:hypothetical protein QJS10_CPA01g02493 [Acorus calamus]|uniref:Rab-GAP TBC domain-containing protein n=1 Tax=Acorus calamus TaxID=4465 RepID=A0AAV9FGS8_ACOCL|nr:hypothetical protein QJS10_CPA01g02493 [Acorus calamus]
MKALRRTHTTTSSSSRSISSSSPPSSSWIHLRSLLVVAASSPVSDRGTLKSPWSRRKRKRALSPHQWNSLFSPDGQIIDGVKLLKKVRSGGVDPSIRAEVWPFLLGVYNLNSSKAEREAIKIQNRKEYENLRRQCRKLLKHVDNSQKKTKEADDSKDGDSDILNEVLDSPASEDVSARQSLSGDERSAEYDDSIPPSNSVMEEDDRSGLINMDSTAADTESSGTETSIEDDNEDSDVTQSAAEGSEEKRVPPKENISKGQILEDFTTWQRIIRLDAIRANDEWIVYSPAQATVSEAKSIRAAQAVGLKDYDHLEPCRIHHAARLVAVLEAYALYDPETGYCQGMSDLLSPILAVIEEDHEAFWCFVGFMKKARHNFRLDEVGIRRQLNTVSKIIKSKDSHLYRHLEKLQAEDCFFVYRMVVVLFRRELSFEQTVCLWEVMWADQAAIRAGIGKSAWGRIRQRAPPTEDLLLYAIAACVLQRRKLIIEKYSSMDEILRECNSMAGQLDVWKLLDDAHDLVVGLHDKI